MMGLAAGPVSIRPNDGGGGGVKLVILLPSPTTS